MAALVLPMVCAAAAEYASVGEHPAVMYDAPSVRARQVWVVSPLYPLEVVVALEGWVKARDAAGDLAWIEKKFLSSRRTLIVTAPSADVRSEPKATAPLVFQAGKGVILERLEGGAAGWVRVRHAEGQTGFVAVSQVWGS